MVDGGRFALVLLVSLLLLGSVTTNARADKFDTFVEGVQARARQ
jgi:hypothetical protein